MASLHQDAAGRCGRVLQRRRRLERRTSDAAPKPSAMTGSAELNATAGRVAPAILGLLADGVPRTVAAVAQALADRHEREDVIVTMLRLAATEQVRETDGRYTLAVPE